MIAGSGGGLVNLDSAARCGVECGVFMRHGIQTWCSRLRVAWRTWHWANFMFAVLYQVIEIRSVVSRFVEKASN